jgi:hypothetical protein
MFARPFEMRGRMERKQSRPLFCARERNKTYVYFVAFASNRQARRERTPCASLLSGGTGSAPRQFGCVFRILIRRNKNRPQHQPKAVIGLPKSSNHAFIVVKSFEKSSNI